MISDDTTSNFISYQISKFIVNIEHNEKEIKKDYEECLSNELRRLYIKYNVKMFTYFENNVIFKIYSLLNLSESCDLGLTSKKNNELFRMIPRTNIIKINFEKNYLIKNCPHIKFMFNFSNHTKIVNYNIKKLDNIYELIVPSFNNKTFPIRNVQKLSLQAPKLIRLPKFNNIIELKLLDCKMTNYSILKNTTLKYLQLKYCDINTTYGLEDIDTIELICCYKIKHIIYLNKVKNLYLIDCMYLNNICHFDNINEICILNSIKSFCDNLEIELSHRFINLWDKKYNMYFKNIKEDKIINIINIFKRWNLHSF